MEIELLSNKDWEDALQNTSSMIKEDFHPSKSEPESEEKTKKEISKILDLIEASPPKPDEVSKSVKSPNSLKENEISTCKLLADFVKGKRRIISARGGFT